MTLGSCATENCPPESLDEFVDGIIHLQAEPLKMTTADTQHWARTKASRTKVRAPHCPGRQRAATCPELHTALGRAATAPDILHKPEVW